MATIQQRKPRYRRVPSVSMRLQERDAEIIKLAHKYRFLTSEHIGALVQGSQQGILRRLHLLFHGGYLDRPPEQIRPYRRGSAPMIYGLGNKGADLLAQEYGISRERVDWTSKNREVKKVYLEHTLMVSHFMVCLHLACRKQSGMRLIEPGEILSKAPLKERQRNNPTSWKVKVEREFSGVARKLQLSLVPDKIFGLHFPNEPQGMNKVYFFLEADRATMPVKRNNFFTTSYYRKMIGYWESWRQKLFQNTFGFNNARVLTITKSAKRIDNMIGACKEVDGRKQGSKMFLFAQASEFGLEDNKILEKVWRNGRDNVLVSLVD